MKNKQAEKLKKKRRAERDAKRKAELQKVIDEVNAYRAEIGKPPASDDIIIKTYRKCVNKYILDGVQTPVFITMYILNKVYGYGHLRLYRYLMCVERYIQAANDMERNHHQFREDIHLDLNIDVAEIPDIYNDTNLTPEKRHLLYNCRTGLVFAFYPFYFDYKWSTKRVKRLHNEVVTELLDVVANDRIGEVKHLLEKKAKLTVSNGKLSIKKPDVVIKKEGELND